MLEPIELAMTTDTNKKRPRFPPWLLAALIMLAGLAILGVLIWEFSGRQAEDLKRHADLENRVKYLRAVLVQRRNAALRLSLNYHPNPKAALSDLSIPASQFLNEIPCVAAVSTSGVKEPAKRLIHLLDASLVDWQTALATTPGLDDEEKKLRQTQAELQTAISRAELLTVLDCLVKEHGLQAVWSWDVCAAELPTYLETVKRLKEELPHQGADTAQVPSQKFQQLMLQIGPAGWLLISGKLKDVVPLAGNEPIFAAKSKDVAGRKAALLAAAEKVLGHPGNCQVVILPGSADLTEIIQQIAPQCEYVRVATSMHRTFVNPQPG